MLRTRSRSPRLRVIRRSGPFALLALLAITAGCGAASPGLVADGASGRTLAQGTGDAARGQPGDPGAAPVPDSLQPKLVVVITVDQMRGDYYDRFASQLNGGLARLYRRGAVFANAHQDHAITETAPGHATVLSGRFPSHTGIVANSAGVQDPQAPLIGSRGPGASPFRFRGSTLIDWMRLVDPASRALSVSRKDRGAILPIGRAHQHAFWYPGDGDFTTSTYYADTLPTWVQRFNARHLPQQYTGRSWTLLRPEGEYSEPDAERLENGGNDRFPHVLPSDTTRAVAALISFPWMDDVIADAALAGVQAMQLGVGEHPDLLAVSFSTTDAIGHAFGPDSRELHDQILRLDQVLGRFIDSLYTLRDSSRIVFALTADHGVAPLPEVQSHDPNGSARRVEIRPLLAATRESLVARGLPGDALTFESGVVDVDRPAFAAAGVNADSTVGAFAAAVRRLPGVLRADRWVDLARADTVRDAIARRWLHMFPPDLRPALVVTLTPYSTYSAASYFQHGAPHDHDTHVPVVFYGAPFQPGRYDRYTRVVDLAPTLAAVLGISPSEPLDGRVLTQALRVAAPPPGQR